jgi:hypothetical protein
MRPVVIEIEKTRGVVESIAVDLAERDDYLQRMAHGMLGGNASGCEKAERAPAELLSPALCQLTDESNVLEPEIEVPTAVTASIHTRNASDLRYLESEREYSFHSSPKRSLLPAIVAWWRTK